MTSMELIREAIDQMLEEVAGYQVDLAEDPTLPHLGMAYLQKAIASTRNYTNRTMFYLQKVLRYEKDLKREVKTAELDLEFKIKEKLADDQMVRKQPSIEDRKAAATVLYRVEYDILAEKKAMAVDVEESAKLLRMKYHDLQRTSNEVKLQRQMVKDDMEAQLRGDPGYGRPVVNQDRSVPDGMKAPVDDRADPKDLLSGGPQDFPEPKDEVHAQMMQEFLSRNPEVYQPGSRADAPVAAPAQVAPPRDDGRIAEVNYDDLLA